MLFWWLEDKHALPCFSNQIIVYKLDRFDIFDHFRSILQPLHIIAKPSAFIESLGLESHTVHEPSGATESEP